MTRETREAIPFVAWNEEYPGGPQVPPHLQPLWVAARQARTYAQYLDALAAWQAGVQRYTNVTYPQLLQWQAHGGAAVMGPPLVHPAALVNPPFQ